MFLRIEELEESIKNIKVRLEKLERERRESEKGTQNHERMTVVHIIGPETTKAATEAFRMFGIKVLVPKNTEHGNK